MNRNFATWKAADVVISEMVEAYFKPKVELVEEEKSIEFFLFQKESYFEIPELVPESDLKKFNEVYIKTMDRFLKEIDFTVADVLGVSRDKESVKAISKLLEDKMQQYEEKTGLHLKTCICNMLLQNEWGIEKQIL